MGNLNLYQNLSLRGKNVKMVPLQFSYSRCFVSTGMAYVIFFVSNLAFFVSCLKNVESIVYSLPN